MKAPPTLVQWKVTCWDHCSSSMDFAQFAVGTEGILSLLLCFDGHDYVSARQQSAWGFRLFKTTGYK